ncbi:hypothetical protein BH23ACT4_BH23ACT4_06620 [soil metagenome]
MTADSSLDELVEQITVDCYGDEGFWAFLEALTDEVRFPIRANLAGIDVSVTGVDFDGNARRGIVALIQRGDHHSTFSVFDIEVSSPEEASTRCLAAYRYWLSVA